VAPLTDGVCLGYKSIVFSNIVGGTPPFKTKWVDLGTGTASDYTLAGVNMTNLQVQTDTAFTQIGTIDLELTTTDDIGCIATALYTVYVNPIPTIEVHPESVATCPGGTVTFTFEVTETNIDIVWVANMPNGTSFIVPGNKTNTLVVEDVTEEMNGTKYQGLITLLNGGPGPVRILHV